MLIAGLELQVGLLALGHCAHLLVGDVEVESQGGVSVHGADHPLAGVALADLCLGHARPLLSQGRQATYGAAALELAGGEDLDLGVEAQLEVACLVAVEHLPEGVLEDVHAEGVTHNHEATSLVGAHLHLVEPDLVEGAGIDVDGEAARNSPGSQACVVLERLLRVLGVRGLLLQVQVRANGLCQLLANNHARAHVAGPADDEGDSHAALRAGGLHQAQRHAQGGARAPEGPAVRASGWPGVSGEVVQEGVQRELALGHRQQEAPGSRRPRSDARVVLQREAQLVGHLLGGVLLATSEGIGLGKRRGAQLVDVAHSTEGDEAHECILRHHGQGLLQGVLRLLELFLNECNVQDQQEDRRLAN
mmetsp:Transcript_68051/g.122652  ORF Transcript_68051/g.122652 Transcript_68051/m.122652 type:complete len:362 (-) Transcript_68051:400-1485(-)